MIKQRLDKLKYELKKHNYHGYLIPSGDEYMSEYTPAHAKRLEYMTGFTGSNGLAIILQDQALFFTDGRYIQQSKLQLDKKLLKIYNQNLLLSFDPSDYNIPSSCKIAYDPSLVNQSQLKLLDKLNLAAHEKNLVDSIWSDQPPRPNSKIYKYDSNYAGLNALAKIKLCRKFLSDNDGQALLISDPASVCWTLNIRASDVDYSPILLAYLLVTHDQILLFTNKNRDGISSLSSDVEIKSSETLKTTLESINGKIIFDKNQSSVFISSIIEKLQHTSKTNPCMIWKSCKNQDEIRHAQKRHIEDAVAVCKMLYFLESNDLSSTTEHDISIMLTELRSRSKNYISDSFATICGFKENGAIIHYKPKKETSKKISGNGLLLIDSGGQYLGATTDITRVIAIGEIRKEYVEYYTRVLKGHIALAKIKFPRGKVSGAHLDVLARQYLWELYKDYAHGTGHGVGNFLSVHEGPQNIGIGTLSTPLEAGMILSNEPGYYVNNEFGIRIENLMYVKQESDNFLGFEMLTLVPYAKNLIDFSMLSNQEILFLKDYYKKIDSNISPLLSKDEKVWLSWQLQLDSYLNRT